MCFMLPRELSKLLLSFLDFETEHAISEAIYFALKDEHPALTLPLLTFGEGTTLELEFNKSHLQHKTDYRTICAAAFWFSSEHRAVKFIEQEDNFGKPPTQLAIETGESICDFAEKYELDIEMDSLTTRRPLKKRRLPTAKCVENILSNPTYDIRYYFR